MAARGDKTLHSAADALVCQCRALAELAAGSEAASFEVSARARLVVLVDDVLTALQHPTNARPQSFASLLDHRSVGSAHLAAMTRELASTTRPETLARLCASRTAELGSELAGQLPVAINNEFGNSSLADYLRATLLEVAVLALPGHPQLLQASSLRSCARSLSQALGERFAGHTIEVRIPPASAVQLGAFGQGPTHTRGTPPNVVETDELTWLQLGTGLLELDQAIAEGRVTASGAQHMALDRMLPVINLARRG